MTKSFSVNIEEGLHFTHIYPALEAVNRALIETQPRAMRMPSWNNTMVIIQKWDEVPLGVIQAANTDKVTCLAMVIDPSAEKWILFRVKGWDNPVQWAYFGKIEFGAHD